MIAQEIVAKTVAIDLLCSEGLIPANLPKNDPLVITILSENFEPITSEDGSTVGWVKFAVPFTPTPGEQAIREFYSQIRSKTVSFNRALKLIRRCFKKVGIHLDFKKMFENKNTQQKLRLVKTFFVRCADNEYAVQPHFALRFKPSLIDGLPLVQQV